MNGMTAFHKHLSFLALNAESIITLILNRVSDTQVLVNFSLQILLKKKKRNIHLTLEQCGGGGSLGVSTPNIIENQN